MVSVTSIVPSGMTSVSDWKFSMRSSRVLSAETVGKRRTANRAAAEDAPMRVRQTRLISGGAPESRCWRAEADFGSLALCRRGDLEEFARLESQHVGENIRRELLDLGVQVAHHGVVIAPRVLHGVFDLRQGILQRSKALDRAELRIRLGQCKQALERAGKHVLRLGLVAGAGGRHGSIA